MGLNQGVFPQSMGDEGLIKDKERQELADAGITLAEGALPKAFQREFPIISRHDTGIRFVDLVLCGLW